MRTSYAVFEFIKNQSEFVCFFQASALKIEFISRKAI